MLILLDDGTWWRKELLRVTWQSDECFANNFVRICYTRPEQPAPPDR